MIIGHTAILNFFDQAIKSGQLANTYCFVGPDQIGKRTVAKHLAAGLLKTTPEKLANHPDFYYIERARDEKTGKLKKDIAVGQARGLNSFLRHKSWLGGYQIVIIDEAELFNEESANALLKILEEPPVQSVIFLLTENDAVLLPTIRSRTQLLYFSRVDDRVIQQHLESLEIPPAVVTECVTLAWGRPGRAVAIAENEARRQSYQETMRLCQDLSSAPLYQKVQSIEKMFSDKTDHIQGREEIQERLLLWIAWWREQLLASVGGAGFQKLVPPTPTSIFSPAHAIQIIDTLVRTHELIRQNIHPRLLLEGVLLKF